MKIFPSCSLAPSTAAAESQPEMNEHKVDMPSMTRNAGPAFLISKRWGINFSGWQSQIYFCMARRRLKRGSAGNSVDVDMVRDELSNMVVEI